ncbi:EndoU domain-containing protein [Nocardia heshunensis]
MPIVPAVGPPSGSRVHNITVSSAADAIRTFDRLMRADELTSSNNLGPSPVSPQPPLSVVKPISAIPSIYADGIPTGGMNKQAPAPDPAPATPNPQPAQSNPPPAQNPQSAQPIQDTQPTGPIPASPGQLAQPVVPAPAPLAVPADGTQWQSAPNTSSVVVPGSNGQTIDSTIHNTDNTTTEVRARAEAEGTYVWTAFADGSHSVTFIPVGGGLQTTYTVPAGGDPVNGATSVTIGDGKGNWAKETLQPNGDPAYQTIEKQPDGTYYVTDALPGGGTTTKAFRPGNPEFSTPWLVGESRPDHSGYLTRTDGSTKRWGPDGSGSISGGLDSTTSTFGTDQWNQKFTQTIDPINKQIVTEVLKDANTDHPWTEVIISDLEHEGEGHYRQNADGTIGELLWQRVPGYKSSDAVHTFDENRVVPDKYVLEPNPSGGVFVKEDGVTLGTITTSADGTKVFKPTKAYGERTNNVLTQEIILSADQKKSTTIFSIFGEDWQQKGHRELNTQYGEFPGIPWAGSEKGANGQDYTSFSGKFGDAFLGTYQGMLPLAGIGGPGSPGVGEAWGALAKNLAKTAAIAGLTLQFGPAGYRVANSGEVPGLNKGEANRIVSDLADSFGYTDFRQGNFAAGLGTLLGTLAATSAINKAGGLVARPVVAGIKTAARPLAASAGNTLADVVRAGAAAAGPLIDLVHDVSATFSGPKKVFAAGADSSLPVGNGTFHINLPPSVRRPKNFDGNYSWTRGSRARAMGVEYPRIEHPQIRELPALHVPDEKTWLHVLKGEINEYGKPTGYHYRPNGRDRFGVRATELTEEDSNGVYMGTVNMDIWTGGEWRTKSARSSFFPDGWTTIQVKRAIEGASRNATYMPNGKWSGVYGSLKIQGYYDIKTGRIITGYPIWQGKGTP